MNEYCITGAVRAAVPGPALGAVPVGERRRGRGVGGLGPRAPRPPAVHAHRLRAHAPRPPLQRRVLRLRRGPGHSLILGIYYVASTGRRPVY